MVDVVVATNSGWPASDVILHTTSITPPAPARPAGGQAPPIVFTQAPADRPNASGRAVIRLVTFGATVGAAGGTVTIRLRAHGTPTASAAARLGLRYRSAGQPAVHVRGAAPLRMAAVDDDDTEVLLILGWLADS